MASINLGRVQGYSAYEIAVQNGYSGTEQEWLASLKGTNGTNGTNGVDGVSPEVSVERNQADTGVDISVTDATGTTTATVYDGETPSLTGYATETYVDNAVGAIDVPTATSDLTNDSGFITSSDLSGYAQTSSLATVATSGDYDDLTNKPTIPDVSGLATTTALTTGLATKQDTLIAGENITITNNEISATGGSSVSIISGNYINVDQTDNDYIINAMVYPTSASEIVTDVAIISINATPKYADDVTEWEVTNADFSDPQWTDWLGESNRYMELAGDGGTFYSFYIDDSEQSSPYAGTDGEVVTVDTYLTISVPGDYSDRTLATVSLGHEGTTMVGLVDYDTLEEAIGSVGGLPPISQGDSGKVLTVNRSEDGAEWVSPEAELPVIGASDEGKVLTVGVSGVEWDTVPTPSIATAQTAGLVKPDGTTITIDANGTISSSGGSSTSVVDSKENVIVPITNTTYQNSTGTGVGNMYNAVLGYKNSLANSGYAMGNIVGGYSNILNEGASDNIVGGSTNTLAQNYGTMQSPQHSIVGGNNNRLVGNRNAIVVGTGLTSMAWNQAVFGLYNATSDAALVIGNGSDSSNKSDAFKVTSAGNGVFAGTVQATDFLDSNGNSIVGGGGDSFPTINSGDAGKALVVNSGETGVEWATVGGGSVPLDPEASSNNVYTGDGYWNNAYTVWEDASINSLTITPSTPVTQSSNIFTLTTTTDFAGWGTQPLHMQLVGETMGSEYAEWEGDMLIWGSSGDFCTYRDAEEYWELNRTESNGTYTYTLERIMYEQSSSIDTLSSFFISGDKFKTKLNDYGVQTRSIDINPGSDYIGVSGEYGSDYSNYTITPVLYPDQRETRVTDTTITTINATGSVVGDNTMWQVSNVDFTDQQWIDWLASSGRAMRLFDDGGNEIWLQIDIDDSETSSPYSGRNGETITVDRYLEISVPDTSWDGTVLDSIELSHLTTEDYGLITYNNLPDVTLNHITLIDQSTGDPYQLSISNGQIVLTNMSM